MYLISAFSTGGHPLQRLLAVLSGLNPTNMVRQFGMVDDYDLEPTRSIYDYPLETLSHVPNVNNGCGGTGTEFCWKGLLPNGGTSVGGIGDVFFTDGSMGGGGVGTGGSESRCRRREPSGVFTSAMSAIFVDLIQIGARHPGRA
jgi:hypothetical protein